MANELNTNNNKIQVPRSPVFSHSRILEQRPRSSGFKSFLNWFKKVESLQRNEEIETTSAESDDSSSTSSTATVASFAFLPANVYKPFGDAQQPEKYIAAGPYTETYHKLLQERNKRRKMDKNLTLRKKYSLYSSGTLPNSKENNEDAKEYDTFSLPTVNKTYGEARKTASLTTKGSCHVKGKRRAPPPPVPPLTLTARRKRKAPPPPLNIQKEEVVIEPEKPKPHENSPVAERSPKPWYKRESKIKSSKNTKNDLKKKTKPEYPEIGFFRCSRIFENKKPTTPDKGEEKRMSCFLPNISELDREAAEIIKMHKENSENGNIGHCRPSSAKDLINKFNALTNATSKQEESSPKLLKQCNKSPINILRRKNIRDLKDISLSKNENQRTPEIPRKFFPEDIQRSNVFKLSQCSRCHAATMGDPCTSCTNHDIKNIESGQSFQEEVFSALPGFNYVSSEKDKSQVYQKLNDLEEKVRLRELLKEMKNSLPKKQKPDSKKEETKELPPDEIPSVSKISNEIPKPAEEQKEQNIVIVEKVEEKPTKITNIQAPPEILKTTKVSSSSQTGNCVVKKLEPRKPQPSPGLYSNVKEPVAVKSDLSELLKKLEIAIADGNDVMAAKLAKDLALLKVNCSVVTAPLPENKLVEKRLAIITILFSNCISKIISILLSE